jgi:transcriptional regulator with XRE-family HTH domain
MPRRVSKTAIPHLPAPPSDTAARGGRVVSPAELGTVLRWIRGLKGMPQTEAAASLGVSPELLRGLEKGDRGVHLGTALELLARLGLDVVLIPRDRALSLHPSHAESTDKTPTSRRQKKVIA